MEDHLATPATALTSEEMALLRTRLALERTLMAWVRTALSMISFGFTIYKFFEAQPAPPLRRSTSPRDLGLALIAMGTAGLMLASWEHRAQSRELLPKERPRSVAQFVSWMLVLVGIVAFFAVLNNV